MDYQKSIKDLCFYANQLSLDEKVDFLNEIRKAISSISPFKDQPVDCIQWIKVESVKANDYNPNSVAPPEMELLRHSINHDGYTQPVVAWKSNETIEVIDGFHRTRVCKECNDVNAMVNGYLPVVLMGEQNTDRSDRVASTIRHNRARGKHNVSSMSDIIIELKNRNWKNSRIAKELGMDEDEILRLCQITGLSELFTDDEFSKSWTVDESNCDDNFIPLEDDFDGSDVEVRTVNTDDEDRIFHTFDKWECNKAGFYLTVPPTGMTHEECEAEYASFLSDDNRFSEALELVISEWKHSCEHYLTNKSMNRIAWLGQAAMCYATGVPSKYRTGFSMLKKDIQEKANQIALSALNKWLANNGRDTVTIEEAMPTRQSTIY